MNFSFTQAVALAALASYTSAELVCKSEDTGSYPDYGSECGIPEWALFTASDYDRHEVTVGGYKLTMLRVTSSTSAEFDPVETGTNGPVLFYNGIFNDTEIWKQHGEEAGTTVSPFFTTTSLFDAKYDVWIAFPRGTRHSEGHETYDSTQSDSDYWNFGFDQLAKDDIPAFINEILTTRKDEASCQKVSLVTHDKGGSFSMIAMNAFPTTASAVVQNVVNNTPCFVPDESQAIDPDFVPAAEDSGEESGEDDDDHDHDHSHGYGYYRYSHSHSHSHSYSRNSYSSGWDRNAYYAAFSELREELDYAMYREIYYAYRDWERENYHNWWIDNNWAAGLEEAVCSAMPENSRCQPDTHKEIADWYQSISNQIVDIRVLFGPNWTQDLEKMCVQGEEDENPGEDKFPRVCAKLRSYLTYYDDNGDFVNSADIQTPQMSVQMYYHYLQQAIYGKWTQINPAWEQNSWLDFDVLYEVDQISVPVSNIFVDNDDICNEKVQQAITDMIPTQQASATLHDGRTHAGEMSIAGDNDAYYISWLLTLLGAGANDTLECADLVVGDWE